MPELSIVIPVYNNADSLEILVKGIVTTLSTKLKYELILVNDGSTDKSWEIILQLLKEHSFSDPVIAIDLKENYGQENAKMAGLKYTSGDHIVFMDADCQHAPEHIFQLLKECENGSDVCYANFSNSPISLFKRTGSGLYNYLAYKLLKKPRGIYLSSFNMIKKSIADKVILYSSPIVNIDAMVLRETQNVTQIFVEQQKSLNKQTNYTAMKLIALFFRLLPGYSTLPLRLILIAGGAIFCLGSLLILAKITIHFTDPSAHFFIGTGKLLIITIGGIILTAIGIIGEYIGKIYLMLGNTKQFEIKTRTSSDANEKK
jgi:glycosyltransferase involved in cell wall biosynthesis